MRDQLAKELENIGLSEKEAKVYLAALELGASTAQSIAAKATVNRPTTYVMIESLIKRGLMSSFEKGKKRFFLAAPPNQILYLISTQKRELLEKEKMVVDLIQKVSKFVEPQKNLGPIVSLYEGIEGMSALQADVLESDADEILELTSVDKVKNFLPVLFPQDTRRAICKKFKIKSLYTSTSGPLPPESNSKIQSRILPRTDEIDIQGEVIVFGKKTALISYSGELRIAIISDSDIAATLSTLFHSLWKSGKKDN